MFYLKISRYSRYLLFLSFLFWGCNNGDSLRSQPKGGELKCLRISYGLPITGKHGELVLQAENTIEVFYYKDIRVYQFNRTFDSVVNGVQQKTYKLPSYFVFEKDRPFGILYNDSIKGLVQRHSVADFLKERAFSDINFYQSIEKGDIKLLSFTAIKSLGTLDEVYVSTGNSSPGDTIHFSYSDRLKDYDYTFSKQLDSLKSSKLYRVRAIIAADYYAEQNYKTVAREMNLLLEEIEAPDKASVLAVISTYAASEK